MISCHTLLACLLIIAAHSDELLLQYNPEVHFEGKSLSVFISSADVPSSHKGVLTYTFRGNEGQAGFRSYLMVCSAEPHATSTYLELATFIKESCQAVIPVLMFNDQQLSNGCVQLDSSSYKVLLMVFVGANHVLYYFGQNSPTIIVNFDSKGCDAPLKTVVGLHSLDNSYHSDFVFQAHSDIPNQYLTIYSPQIAGSLGDSQQCRKMIFWTEYNKTLTFLAGSTSGILSMNKEVHENSIIMRCILRVKDWPAEEDITLVTFLSYSGHVTLQSDKVHYTEHPPISKENPFICHSHSYNSSNSAPIADMMINGIYQYRNVSTKLTILACSTNSSIDDDWCDGIFMPIFSGARMILPQNSSFFLGPSHGYDSLAFMFDKDSASDFCIDLDLAEDPGYKINVMLFAKPGGTIPPNSYHNIDLSCPYNYEESLSAIMYRTHTHRLGRSVSMWVQHKNTWTLVASENRTNAIIPLPEPFHIRINDTLNVRCSYDSHGIKKPTLIGPDENKEEMCNFYLYYITNATSGVEIRDCFLEAQAALDLPFGDDFDHQRPRNRYTYGTNLKLIKYWSLQAQSAQGNLGICNLEHENTIILILERYAENFREDLDWFDDDNVLKDFHRVIKTNALTVYSMLNNSVVHSFGANRFYLPTGLYLTSDEVEVIVTDLGLHQVIRFPSVYVQPRDRPDLVLGTAFAPGNDRTHFCKPTSVLTDPDDNIYVGDGLCNSRIVKFEDDGYYVGAYGVWSSERGILGTFGEVTDLAIDLTRKVILALDNKLKQIQIMGFSGEFYQVIDVARYNELLKVCYSPDMDATLLLTSYGLESAIVILDPVTAVQLNYVSSGTRSFSAITIWPGNNTVVVGDRSGMIQLYSDGITEVTISVDTIIEPPNDTLKSSDQESEYEIVDDSLARLSPLIHYLLRPGLFDEEEEEEENTSAKTYIMNHLMVTIGLSVGLLVASIIAIVTTVRCCIGKGSETEYSKCLSSSESDDEEDVIFDTLHERFENTDAL